MAMLIRLGLALAALYVLVGIPALVLLLVDLLQHGGP
jgi:hypothetical protein